MYYPYNQQSTFFSFSDKELIHNGNRYDATPFIEKSEVAQKIYQNNNSYSFEDGITEQVFETFFCLAVGQMRQCPPEFIPNILELASQWKCNNVEPEIERQILEYPNPNLILHVLFESPNHQFPRIYEFIRNNLSIFIRNPNLCELPVTSLGRIFCLNEEPNNNHPNSEFSLYDPTNQNSNTNAFAANGQFLQGNNYKNAALQIINRKRDEEKRHKEMKKIEAIKNDKIQSLKVRSDNLLFEKNNLINQSKILDNQNNSLSLQIENKKKQLQNIESQTQRDIKSADEIRNQIQKLKREINKKEQAQKEIIENKKRNRQSRK